MTEYDTLTLYKKKLIPLLSKAALAGVLGLMTVELTYNAIPKKIEEALLQPMTQVEMPLEERLYPVYADVCEKFGLGDNELLLLVDGQRQKMYLVSGNSGSFDIHGTYDVSTGKAGYGNIEDSEMTPTGIHMVMEKYGSNQIIGTVFRGRDQTGEVASINPDRISSREDLVTSRILWLGGWEEQNVNTHSRNIYIHGTADEGLIGAPVSHGCIRMKNKDVVELYDKIRHGTLITIQEQIT